MFLTTYTISPGSHMQTSSPRIAHCGVLEMNRAPALSPTPQVPFSLTISDLGMWNTGQYRKRMLRHLTSAGSGHAACKTNGQLHFQLRV